MSHPTLSMRVVVEAQGPSSLASLNRISHYNLLCAVLRLMSVISYSVGRTRATWALFSYRDVSQTLFSRTVAISIFCLFHRVLCTENFQFSHSGLLKTRHGRVAILSTSDKGPFLAEISAFPRGFLSDRWHLIVLLEGPA